MCDNCGCSTSEEVKNTQKIDVMKDILHSNNHQADHIREHIKKLNIKSFNLMSSPGSGKTTVLERTIEALPDKKIAVIEGDLETENDAKRIRDKGALAHQIMTNTSCHLDAFMVHNAIHKMNLKNIDYLFVENVGNLVCPASFDVGTQKNVVLLSATEGDDKPAKYPVMFHIADLVLNTKTEAAELMNFDIEKAKRSVAKVNSEVPILTLSLKDSDEFDKWIEYLDHA